MSSFVHLTARGTWLQVEYVRLVSVACWKDFWSCFIDNKMHVLGGGKTFEMGVCMYG
jgi:hypothetical protein